MPTRTILLAACGLLLLATLPGATANAAPAASAFDGDVTFGGAGTLTLEIDGLSPGTQHDQLTVAGTAALDGALALVPGGSFMPLAGDSFALLTWGSRTGEFTTVSGVQQPADLDLALRYDGAAAIVAVVLRGDVNGDGFLDAADTAIVNANQGLSTTDYTAWRG
jgi:hypothetical protein